ncbi:MAG: DUF4230 domain-containing protein [Lachnospiraceae bacterium]|nr:DUF4230 domain-containing protein [Lachnospiraceae bacterium]
MKKNISIIIISIMIMSLLASCGQNSETVTISTDAETQINAIEPELSEIRSICNLATLECYYHNVAKSTKGKGSGVSHAFEQERVFWIEYTGVAKIGIDVSKIKMEIDGTDITITIPNAHLISADVEEISADDYISSSDGLIIKNPISADDQTNAVAEAQEAMKESVESNSTLLTSAQERAKKLIQNYIDQLSDATGIEYNIQWNYEENITSTSEQDVSAEEGNE